MKWIILILILGISVLHHDVWWWTSKERVFGFIPIGLAWHAFISIAASMIWVIAVFTCWPDELDKRFDQLDATAAESGSEEE
ncbi:MAG: DUF3311 domain-containing protein [Planctomycetota bacterium]|nr:DUF3311 domain-containing protein [Planctomycetota bacterium]MDA1137962.1 DUF3311 domain-containing protein [Planctomycetota bacterium]